MDGNEHLAMDRIQGDIIRILQQRVRSLNQPFLGGFLLKYSPVFPVRDLP
jgi:hypothetical protein